MAQKETDLSIILPSYLEAENLRILLPRIKKAAAKLTRRFEILVVDTVHPMDSTESVCREHGARYLPRENGNNYGDAITTGIRSAAGTYILFMDADGSHSPEDIGHLYGLRGKKTVVMASRYIEGGYTDNKKSLVLMSKILNSMYSLILGLPYKDISNSFKLYDAALLKGLKLQSKNFDIIEEILYKINRMGGVSIIETPYSFKKRMFGETKRNLLAFIFTFMATLVKLRLSIFRIDLIVKYFIAAAVGLVVDFGLYLLLLRVLGVHYFIAGMIGFCIGFLVNFFVGRTFVFTEGSKHESYRKEILLVLLISVVGLGLHQLVLYSSVEFFFINEIVSKAIAVGLTFFWNYFGRKVFVYNT
jgi:dolichol-phosphate mannosyltransferase